MRKVTVLLIFCLILSSVFTVFGSGGKETTTADASKPYAGVTLNALLEGHPTDLAVAELLPEFKEKTGIDVEIEVLPFADMTAKALFTISQKSGDYDVFMDNWGHGRGFIEAGGLEPLNAYMNNPELNGYFDKNDFVEAYLNKPSIDGDYYGMPMYGESSFFMYRKDIFEKHGIKVPTTMDELMTAAKLAQERTNGEVYGITMRGMAGGHIKTIWSGFLWAFGGHYLDENGCVDVYTPEGIAATKFYGEILRKYGPPGVANFGWMENRVAFTQGRAAMTIDATVNGAFNEDKTKSAVAGKVGYAPIPTVPGVKQKGGHHSLYVHSLYLNKHSKNKEAAWLFMSWATSAQTQIKGLELQPNSGATSKKAMQSEVYTKDFGPFRDAMFEALSKANPEYSPYIPENTELTLKVGDAVNAVLVGSKTAEDALRDFQEDMNNNVLRGCKK